MPGSIRSMHVEHVFRDVQTDRGSLLHGRLLRWQFDTATLAHRCRRGASTPSPEIGGLATSRAESEAADVKRCGRLAVAEVGHDGRQMRTRDDVEQLLLIDRKARPDLAQVVDRVDVGNDGVMARPFQPLVVETAARTLADNWRLWRRNCAE